MIALNSCGVATVTYMPGEMINVTYLPGGATGILEVF